MLSNKILKFSKHLKHLIGRKLMNEGE